MFRLCLYEDIREYQLVKKAQFNIGLINKKAQKQGIFRYILICLHTKALGYQINFSSNSFGLLYIILKIYLRLSPLLTLILNINTINILQSTNLL